MNIAKVNSRFRAILVAVLATILCGTLVSYLFLAYSRTPQARSGRLRASPVVGLWIGPDGNAIDLRSDGTARSRLSPTSKQIGYFEWTLDGATLRIFQYSQPRSSGWYLRRLLLDESPTDLFFVDSVSSEELLLRTKGGQSVRFVPASDRELQSAP